MKKFKADILLSQLSLCFPEGCVPLTPVYEAKYTTVVSQIRSLNNESTTPALEPTNRPSMAHNTPTDPALEAPEKVCHNSAAESMVPGLPQENDTIFVCESAPHRTQDSLPEKQFLDLTETIEIEPHSLVVVPTPCSTCAQTVYISASDTPPSACFGIDGISTVYNKKVNLVICNPSSSPQTVRMRDLFMDTVEPESSSINTIILEEDHPEAWPLPDPAEICKLVEEQLKLDHLPKEDKNILLKVIEEFRDIFVTPSNARHNRHITVQYVT